MDYEELFKSEPKKSDDEWFFKITALGLDDEPPEQPAASAAGAVGEQAAAAARTAATAAAAVRHCCHKNWRLALLQAQAALPWVC